jgi:hypothetical protein
MAKNLLFFINAKKRLAKTLFLNVAITAAAMLILMFLIIAFL